MSNSPENAVDAVCDYCGKENTDNLSSCAGCGAPLLEAAEDTLEKKSLGLAILLALVFGPLGLLYVRAYVTAAVAILVGVPFVLTHTLTPYVMLGARAFAVFWAWHTLREEDATPNISRDSYRLLNKAARLEKEDKNKAIETYREIIRLYPDTPASKEAVQNIETLTRHS